MNKERLTAFSDGVIAIIVTIMVLELKAPHGASFQDLVPLAPIFLSYALSFAYVAIYWNNHHHLFQAVHRVNGRVLLANTHLLFWLSLVPFTTSWMSENHFATAPVALYGFSLLTPGVAYLLLTRSLLAAAGDDKRLARALGSDLKGKLSILFYCVGCGVAFALPWAALALYVLVALMWFIPDSRIEKQLAAALDGE